MFIYIHMYLKSPCPFLAMKPFHVAVVSISLASSWPSVLAPFVQCGSGCAIVDDRNLHDLL